jgi:Protein of unknown function (DUF2934)
MPRKSTGSTTRSKKAAASPDPVVMQPAVVESAQEDVRKKVTVSAAPIPKNGANIDEEIRHRAYELYLQRNGAAGDPNRDWLVAEREVRARHATAGHSA